MLKKDNHHQLPTINFEFDLVVTEITETRHKQKNQPLTFYNNSIDLEINPGDTYEI